MSECEKLAQEKYNRKRDNVARITPWKWCGKYNLKRSRKWYEQVLEGVVENEEVKIFWKVMVKCDIEIKARKPDFVTENKNLCHNYYCYNWRIRVSKKEKEEIERYQELKRKIKTMWNISSITVIPVVVEALGSTSKKLMNCIEDVEVFIRWEMGRWREIAPKTEELRNNVKALAGTDFENRGDGQ